MMNLAYDAVQNAVLETTQAVAGTGSEPKSPTLASPVEIVAHLVHAYSSALQQRQHGLE